MTDCYQGLLQFPSVKRRKVEAQFNGGEVTSDGGLLLLRQVDRRLGLTEKLAAVLPEARAVEKIEHEQKALLRQRIYSLCAGYEDLNDQLTLRHDVALQTAVEQDKELASASTLCRWENRAGRKAARAMHEVLLEQFIASFKEAPEELILDFDATDDRVHGSQEGRSFHGYYGDWCFLPLYVFCGDQLLVSYLRPSNIDAALHAPAILKLLVSRLRKAWPQVKIILRADSGFCRWKMLRWCERHGVHYIVGLARNARLAALGAALMEQAQGQHEATKEKQRLFEEFAYKAHTWDKKRRVILKAEHTDKGSNPRYVVSNLDGNPQALYDTLYCARGEMENRIKEQQLGLFADRTSCHGWWANQFRLLLSSCAYVLMETLRRIGLAGSELCRSQASTLRLKFIKIGAVVVRNTRRVRFLLSSAYPLQSLFAQAVVKLSG